LADRGEVDDDGDVLVTTPGVPPYMLVDTNDADPVETGRVVDQQPLTFGEDGGVRGVPGHGEFRSDDGHGVVIDHEGTQRPVEAGSRDLRSWWRRSCGVLTPDAATLDALVTAEANVKRGRSVAEGLLGQLADDGIANDPVAGAPSAPVISSVRLAFQDGLLPGDVLAGAGQIEGVESAKCRKVRRRESRLGHVEVFRMDGVRTSIIGRPRRLSAQRRAVSWNHRSTLSFTKSHIAVHVGTLHFQCKAVMEEFGDDISPGDVFLINDPYRGGTHFNDVSFVRPIFSEGEIIGFAQNKGHWADIGGSVPGSF